MEDQKSYNMLRLCDGEMEELQDRVEKHNNNNLKHKTIRCTKRDKLQVQSNRGISS